MIRCPNCHKLPEVVHINRKVGKHFCEDKQEMMFTNGIEWGFQIGGVLSVYIPPAS